MSTARYSTDLAGLLLRVGDEAIRATADLRALVAFRAAAVRGRGRPVARAALALIVLLTIAAAWFPAYLPGAAGSPPGQTRFTSGQAIVLLPSAYLGVLVISIISAASSGGGRELLARDQGVAFPVSPTTDHLGALVMAPLNIAWLLQSWVVLGATAFVIGPHNHLLAAQVPVLIWLFVATAVAQLVAWLVELLRRVRHGVWVLRGVVVALAGVAAAVIVADDVVPLLDRSPTIGVILAALHGSQGAWGPWMQSVIGLLAMALTAVLLGAYVAHALARRVPRDELRVESSVHSRRVNPASDFVATLRIDRAGVWRSVPLRRGFTVLALLPGLVAVASALEWYMLNVLPGLVASGGALLFGVNAWCLDGRGALWRESLPVPPRLVFVTRVVVLLEVLLAAIVIALLLASLRAGTPTVAQVVAVLCSTLVVTFQVVSGSMRWSVRRPFAVDMRSARATPAPPLTMVGYSTRLALATTFTGMLFVAASSVAWHWSVLLAVPFLALSLLRLARTSAAWEQAETRSRVVTSVAS
ncbi:MAG TPA: hypothetical protein VK204_04200 [Nocardioidaceae bacterium]|nr:hypothetical protein [Nocardioidaceae bacterium]